MAKASRRKFLCLDCGIDTARNNELYMLINQTWALTGLSKFGMLCVLDVERRIGRKLVKSDFNASYLNDLRTASKSARLISRMTNQGE